jgi:TolA-binding protein
MSCVAKPLLRAWTNAGCDAEKPVALLEHVNECESCAEEVRRIERARWLGRSLPVVTLAPNARREMKFSLMAETRRCVPVLRLAAERRFLSPGLSLRVAIAGALVLSTCVAAVLLPKSWWDVPAPSKPIPATQCDTSQAPSLTSVGRTAPNPRELRAADSESKGQTADPGTSERSNEDEHSASTMPQKSAPRPPAPAVTVADPDDAFASAWASLRSHRPAEAAERFDRLLEGPNMDPSRRADVLYWSAQAHRNIGDVHIAERRCRELLDRFPRAPFAPNAALVLGDIEQSKGNVAGARRYFERALSSPHENVRARAQRALASSKSTSKAVSDEKGFVGSSR